MKSDLSLAKSIQRKGLVDLADIVREVRKDVLHEIEHRSRLIHLHCEHCRDMRESLAIAQARLEMREKRIKEIASRLEKFAREQRATL
jgi:hypothetical protein